jgi:ubiquinone/menaquinone biosynthesis C-methylase UbiE
MTDPAIQFDERASRRLLQTYKTPDIVEQRRIVLRALAPEPGERVLDIGSGPGLMAAELAAAVGPDGRVDGIDVSESMLAIANEQPRENTAAPVTFTAGEALSIPFADEIFDAVVSTQVYEYVSDIPAALAQARRVLRPGGRIAILDTDWDSIVWRSGDRERMQRVLTVWDEHLADPYLPRSLPSALTHSQFSDIRCEVVPMFNVGYRVETFSAGLLEMIAGFVRGRGEVSVEEAAAWAEDLRTLGDGYFFSLNRYLFVATRP